MATSMDDMYKNLEEFEREITCGVCMEHYTEPKVLPCLHYYCKKCIVKMALKKNPFSCPECCKDIKVSPGKEDELPPAHFVNRLEDLYSKQKKALSKDVICEVCMDSHVKAEAFCKQCGKFVCADCIKSHSRMKAFFEGHQIISMSEIQHVGAEELIPPPAKKCRTHDEQQKMYCFECKSLICRDCVIIDHKDHKIEFSKKVAATHRETLSEKTKTLEEVKQGLSEAVKKVQLTAREIEAQGSDVAENIEGSFEKLHQAIIGRKTQLLDKVKHKVHEKTINLKKQEERLNEASAEVQSILDYTQQCVKYCGDDELTMMFSDLENQVKKGIEGLTEKGISANPVEEVDIGANTDCSEKFQEFCSKNFQITQIPVKVRLLEEPPEPVQYCVPHTITISVALANGKKLKGDPVVESQLKSKSYVLEQNAVKKVGDGKYTITYTPRAMGKNELHLFVHNNGQTSKFSFPIEVRAYSGVGMF